MERKRHLLILVMLIVTTFSHLSSVLLHGQIINMYGELIMEATQHRVSLGVF